MRSKFAEVLRPSRGDLLVALAFFAVAAPAILIFGTATPVWFANAVAFTALLHREPAAWPRLLALVWIADTAAISLGQGPPALLALCDIGEVVLAATLVRVTGGLGSPLFSGGALPRFILICIAAPLPSSLLGAGVLWWLDGLPFLATWASWYSGTSLGLLIVAPFLVSWTIGELRLNQFARDRFDRFLRRSPDARWHVCSR